MKIKIIFNKIKEYILLIKKGHLGYAIDQGLNCGKGVIVSAGTSFGSEPYLITLHDNVRVSGGVSFITHDGSVHTLRQNPRYKSLQLYGKIDVGENTFIGAQAIILPNVKIGKNCIIGAGTLLNKSIPDNSIAVGVPAKVIGNTWDFAEKKLKGFPSDWNEEQYTSNMANYLKEILPEPN